MFHDQAYRSIANTQMWAEILINLRRVSFIEPVESVQPFTIDFSIRNRTWSFMLLTTIHQQQVLIFVQYETKFDENDDKSSVFHLTLCILQLKMHQRVISVNIEISIEIN